MVKTRVGYAGGDSDSPTYKSIRDHTETVQIDFDPEKITYGELLNIFWNSHNYTRQTGATQYKNAIFYHNEEQQKQAAASKISLEQLTFKTIRTDIVPLKSFTLAEDYHQKYLLKHSSLKNLLDKYYKNHYELVNSTAAARLNGYAGYNGTIEQLSREIQILGVSDQAKKLLEKHVNK